MLVGVKKVFNDHPGPSASILYPHPLLCFSPKHPFPLEVPATGTKTPKGQVAGSVVVTAEVPV